MSLFAHRSAAIAAAILLAFSSAPLAAQNTWIVDAAGGPGHHFTDLPPAVAAAADGDTILVRAGSYKGVTTSKALTLLGEPNARITSAVAVSGIGAGKTFTLANFTLSGNGIRSRVSLRLSASRGRIHLDRVRIPARCARFISSLVCDQGISVKDCGNVTITRSRIGAPPALDVANSTVAVSGCRLDGHDSTYRGCILGFCHYSRPTPGAVISDATVTFARCTLTGGNGKTYYVKYAGNRTHPSRPALSFTRSSVTIAGDARDGYSAGTMASGQTAPTAAVLASGGRLWRDAAVKLVPNRGGAPVGGSYTKVPGRPVSLNAAGAPPGGTVKLVTISGAGERVVMLIGLPGPIRATPYGPFGIASGTAAVVATTTQGSGEHWSLDVPVPALAALRGRPVMFQALSGKFGSVPFRLSGFGVVVLH